MDRVKIGSVALLVLFLLAAFAFPVEVTAVDKNVKKDKAGTSPGKKEETSSKEKQQMKDDIAIVNGVALSRTGFNDEVARYQQQMRMSGQQMNPEDVQAVKERVLESMVDHELLKQEAAKLGIKASEDETNAQINKLKQRFPNEQEFKNTLQKMNLTETQLHTQIQQDLSIRKMIDQQIASKVSIPAPEVKEFYDSHPDLFKTPETVRASHILIKVDPKASNEEKAKARERITGIQQRIKKGEDFAALAKETSECPSGANGGDLDFFQRGQMVGPFEQAAFALQPGTVSDIVETQFGYHLIKVTDRKDASTVSFDEIKGRIEAHLKQQKVDALLTEHLKELKASAQIKTFLN